MRLDAGQHHRWADGFGDVVDGPEAEAELFILDTGLGRQKDDRNVAGLGILLQLATDLVAIHLRHHDIEQDQIRLRLAGGDAQRLLPMIGHLDLVAILEQETHHGQVFRGVVHDQNGRFFQRERLIRHHDHASFIQSSTIASACSNSKLRMAVASRCSRSGA